MNYEQLMSQRAQEISPSPIRRFFDLAETMKNVISLGVGEPDFRTPWPIRATAISALERQAVDVHAPEDPVVGPPQDPVRDPLHRRKAPGDFVVHGKQHIIFFC